MIFGIEGESSMDRGFEVQSPCCRFWRLCLVQFAWQCISNSELPWITIFRANKTRILGTIILPVVPHKAVAEVSKIGNI